MTVTDGDRQHTTMQHTTMRLAGLHTRDARDHLAALGLLRVLHEQRPDLDAHIVVRGLGADLTIASPVDAADDMQVWLLAGGYRPTPMISPWNAGSGLGLGYSAGRQRTSTTAVPEVAELAHLDPAWAAARSTAVDLVADARSRGWSKPDLLRATRGRMPDGALAWIDACWSLASPAGDRLPAFNRAMGSGGNIGRVDLGALGARCALAVLLDPRSPGWLHEAVHASYIGTRLVEGTGAHLDARGLINPWTILLALEGLVGLSSAMSLRGLAHGLSPWPCTRPPAIYGYDSEDTHELWLPEMTEPTSWPGLVQILDQWMTFPDDELHYGSRAATGPRMALGTCGRRAWRYRCAIRNGQNPLYLEGERV